MPGIHITRVEALAENCRTSIRQVIKRIFAKNRTQFWIESDSASLFWDVNQWVTSKLTEDHEDLIIHEFEERELDKAIDQFVEHTLGDKLGGTDEESMFYNGETSLYKDCN